MRKTITSAAIVLLLVVSLQNPVVSRTTPYGPDDLGPMPDHPWGGDQNNIRQDVKPASTATGIPVIDITHRLIFRWLYIHPVKTRTTPTIVTPNTKPNTPQNGTCINPNIAN